MTMTPIASVRGSSAALCLAALLLTPALGWSQIRIGQTAGFSGPVAAGVKETTDGARLYIDAINAKGGVNGQQIELISLDDKFDPKLAAENARVLINERQVVGMFLTRGTPWCCTSRCSPGSSTCAPPTSVNPNARCSIWT